MNFLNKILVSLVSIFPNVFNSNMNEVETDEALSDIAKAGGVVTKKQLDDKIAEQNQIIETLRNDLKIANEAKDDKADQSFEAFKKEMSEKFADFASENKQLKETLESFKTSAAEEFNGVKSLLTERKSEGEDKEPISLPAKKVAENKNSVKATFIDEFLNTGRFGSF